MHMGVVLPEIPFVQFKSYVNHIQNALYLLEKPSSLQLTASLHLNIDGWKITHLLG